MLYFWRSFEILQRSNKLLLFQGGIGLDDRLNSAEQEHLLTLVQNLLRKGEEDSAQVAHA